MHWLFQLKIRMTSSKQRAHKKMHINEGIDYGNAFQVTRYDFVSQGRQAGYGGRLAAIFMRA